MSDLKEKIRELIEKETKTGRYSVLNTTSNVDLIYQIINNYKRRNQVEELGPDDKLPKKAEMIFVAAPTGAGKDSLVARLSYQNPEKKYVELNMDIFRYYFSEFISKSQKLNDREFANQTNEFAYEMYYTVQEILLQEFPGTNIIITGTLRETDWVEKTFERFKNDEKSDYNVKLACLAVPKKESAISILQRYVGIVNTQQERLSEFPGTARYTSLDYHDETFENFPKNLEYFLKKFKDEPGKLIDSVEVHKRAKNAYMLAEDTKIFETNNPENCMEALDAVLDLRHKPYKTKYEEVALIMHRIKVNKDYMRSQKTLKDSIRDLAIILNYPKVVQKLEELSIDEDETKIL